jgi:hypothetical protein
VGVSEDTVEFFAQMEMSANDATPTAASIAIGTNSTTAPDANCAVGGAVSNTTGYGQYGTTRLNTIPAAGYNYFAWLELAGGAGGVTYTFYGVSAGPPVSRRPGITGMVTG